MSKIQIQDGYQEANPRQSISFNRNKLIIPENISVGGLEARVTFFIAATALDADGLAAATQQALLDGVNLTFRTDVSSKDPRTPIDQETFGQLLWDNWRLLERDAVGGVTSTTGLQKALAAGANELECTIPISLAHIEFLEEGGRICGLGAQQLLDCDLVIRVDADPITALDANVTLTKVGVDLRVIEAEDAEGDREGLTPEVRVVKGNADNHVTGPDGLTLSAEQTGEDGAVAALSATAIEVINVKVNGDVVTADPATPTDVQYAYERETTSSTPETTLQTKRTPLYLVPQTPLAKLKPGPVKISMRSHYADLIVRFISLPLLSHEQVMARIKRRAMVLEDGQEIHAVVTPFVEKLSDAVNLEQLPFCGWEYFTSDDSRFHSEPGIRCRKGDEPRIHLPLKDLVAATAAYQLALADKSDANAAGGAATAVIEHYGRKMPAFVTSTAPAGKRGASKVFLDLRDMLAAGKSEIAKRTSGR